jgi:hypothetical protein
MGSGAATAVVVEQVTACTECCCKERHCKGTVRFSALRAGMAELPGLDRVMRVLVQFARIHTCQAGTQQQHSTALL